MDRLSVNQLAFLDIICCGLHGKTADIGDANVEYLYKQCKRHNLTVIGYAGMQADARTEEWRQEREKAIRKSLLLNFESDVICQELTNQKLNFMRLKGSILQHIYPEIGMRQMSDHDIWIDESGRKHMRDFMKKRGYDVISYGVSNHDVYEKEPIYNFELHMSLFGAAHRDEWSEYYSDFDSMLISSENNEYEKHFSDEEFYVYLILHSFKHHTNSGTGVRTLTDIYVFNNVKGDALDWEHVTQKLRQLGLDGYESLCRTVALKVLSDTPYDELTDNEMALLQSFIEAGTYGNMKLSIDKRLGEIKESRGIDSQRAKRQYLMRRLFPDMEWLKANAPGVYKSRIGIPFYYPYRMVRGFVKRRHQIMGEYKLVRDFEEKGED